MSVALEFQRCV